MLRIAIFLIQFIVLLAILVLVKQAIKILQQMQAQIFNFVIYHVTQYHQHGTMQATLVPVNKVLEELYN